VYTMDPHVSSNDATSGTSFLFTDARGRIVFIDDMLIKLLGYSHPSLVTGKPLHLLVTPMERAANLIDEIGSAGRVYNYEITLIDAREQNIDVRLSAVAARNQDGEFIGADVKIRVAQKTDDQQQAPASHDAAMASSIQKPGDEPAVAKPKNERAAYLLLYFIAQIRTLYVLLARMGGPRIVTALEAVLGKLIAQKKWPMTILSGHVTTDDSEIPEEAYVELLRMVISFGTNIVGRAALVREMQIVDGNISNRAREIAEEGGLRQFLD